MLNALTKPLNRLCQIFTVTVLAFAGVAATGHLPGKISYSYSLTNYTTEEQSVIEAKAQASTPQLAELDKQGKQYMQQARVEATKAVTCKAGEVGCKPAVPK